MVSTAYLGLFCLCLLSIDLASVYGWRISPIGRMLKVDRPTRLKELSAGRKPKLQTSAPDNIISPFDPQREDQSSGDENDQVAIVEEKIALTWANVETVLDDVRPFLQADGGDVELAGLDGAIIKLQLVGACGSCPSSQMTMKMGIEKRLRERIAGIEAVVQQLPTPPALTLETVEGVLDNVRPFLSIAGGSIHVVKVGDAWDSLQPSVTLRMEGSASALQSVKLEIMERISSHFLTTVRVTWV